MIFKGTGTALVTPFRDGAVDYDSYERLLDRQVAAGVDFLVPLATTGETPTLSAEEKVRLLVLTYKHSAPAGLPLLVGCGSNSVPATLENMALLDGPAVSGWLVVVPFYNKPNQEGQYRYFKAVAAATQKPVVIYNVPGRTGANMLPDTVLRIARDCPNVIGIKEASGKMEQVEAILAAAPADFAVLSGDDDLTLQMMKKGAAGTISVASDIVPDKLCALVKAAAASDPVADELDAALQPLYRACFVEPNPIPAKAALSLLGLCSDEMRLPLVSATEQTRELMKTILGI